MNSVFSVTFAGLGVVLLMIAMSVTPIFVDGPHLAYPYARSATRYFGTEHDLPITIKADNTIYVGQNWVEAGKLPQYLITVCRIMKRPVVIQADRYATMKIVREVLAALSAAGIRRVTVRTAGSATL